MNDYLQAAVLMIVIVGGVTALGALAAFFFQIFLCLFMVFCVAGMFWCCLNMVRG